MFFLACLSVVKCLQHFFYIHATQATQADIFNLHKQ